jgi:hypothetical protein
MASLFCSIFISLLEITPHSRCLFWKRVLIVSFESSFDLNILASFRTLKKTSVVVHTYRLGYYSGITWGVQSQSEQHKTLWPKKKRTYNKCLHSPLFIRAKPLSVSAVDLKLTYRSSQWAPAGYLVKSNSKVLLQNFCFSLLPVRSWWHVSVVTKVNLFPCLAWKDLVT